MANVGTASERIASVRTTSERTASERTDGAVVSLGVFDGVHLGHRALIGDARAVADARGLPLVVVTFDPHPMATIRPGSQPRSLASLDRRIELLLAAGADEVDVLTFDQQFARQDAEQFVRSVLVERLCTRMVVVGENFRFGAGAAGSVQTLRDLGRKFGFDVQAAQIRADAEPWSSTRIREHLAAGEIAEANRLLARDYALDGVVVHGDHRGRDLGYPTANLHVEADPVIPADGVYAGLVHALDEVMPAAISIGTNPQFAGAERRIEAYVIDRTGLDLYGRTIEVTFRHYLRPQATFDGLDAFLAQMAQDVAKARTLLTT